MALKQRLKNNFTKIDVIISNPFTLLKKKLQVQVQHPGQRLKLLYQARPIQEIRLKKQATK